ncbi:MAG: hypothetical protein M4579_000566 [Chaenotheca gracillima]|nr:MAG: hypothetical protein M4579_000566 [Chaenotheca gracillima]
MVELWTGLRYQSKIKIRFQSFFAKPIGRYRATHITLSKGKRARKLNKKSNTIGNDTPTSISSVVAAEVGPEEDSKPEIMASVVIGVNNTTRDLEALAGRASSSLKTPGMSPKIERDSHSTKTEDKIESSQPLAAIFVPRSSQPTPLNSHFPLLVHAASQAVPKDSQIRLVSLPKGADVRLSKTLGLPRVGCVGLKSNAPGGQGLIDFVRRCVPEIEIPWMSPQKLGEYLPVNIQATQTTAPVVAKSQRRKLNSTEDDRERQSEKKQRT